MEYYHLKDVTGILDGKKIMIRVRVNNIRKNSSRLLFIMARQGLHTVQCIANRPKEGEAVVNGLIEKKQFLELKVIPKESVVILKGLVVKPPVNLIKPTIKDVEFRIEDFELVSKSEELPFDPDALEEEHKPETARHERLMNRWIDLRSRKNVALIKIKAKTVELFRRFLMENGFMEIHTPKLLGTASESGAEVFSLPYFNKKAYLSQSPQLYKQMMINSDMEKVFEVGPVFRAEKCVSHRHLCEFTGMDMEMEIDPDKNYYQVIELMWKLLTFIFDKIQEECKEELKLFGSVTPFEMLKYGKEPLIIAFKDIVSMLKKAGAEQEEFSDLNNANERLAGKLVKEKYGVDLFIIDQYPTKVRPFYTQTNAEDPNYSNSYDVIMRCEEISSGAQRIHNFKDLMDKVTKQGIDPKSLGKYLESFKHGSKPHGGCGFGLERIVMLFLGMKNIREVSIFPRDPNLLEP